MKRCGRMLWTGFLAASFLWLGACQTPMSPSGTASLSRPASQAIKAAARTGLKTSPPQARLRVQTGPSGRPQLHFAIHYPRLSSAHFGTQALDYAAFARFQVSIQGLGLSTPLFPAAADAEKQNTIPADSCSASGCSLETTITEVPSGENRLALIAAYDDQGAVIPGSTLAAVFTVPTDQTELTVELSYRSTPAAQVVQTLLAQFDPALNLLVADLDPDLLQGFVDQIIGATGDFPNFSYVHHPALVNVPQVAEDLTQAAGDLGALNPANPDYLYAEATVSGTVAGLVASDKVNLQLSDPVSGQILNQSNSSFAFEHVPPGTWQLLVEAPEGYSVSGVPSEVVVSEGQTLDLGNIILTPDQPAVTSLNADTLAPGQTLVIEGSHFHPQPEGNTVTIAGVEIPSEQITVNSSTQLEVVLPSDLPYGDTTVSVAVGSQTASNAPDLAVVPPAPLSLSSSELTENSVKLDWQAVPNATAYKVYQDDVLIDTVSAPGVNRTMSGLDPATQYRFTVSAVVDGVEGLSASQDVITLSAWTAWQGLGPNTENVLAVTAAQNTPDRVWFGSQVGGASLGGIWRCDNGSCNQKADNSVAGSVQALAVSADNPDRLYAGSSTMGVLISNDGGLNWAQSNTGLTSLDVRALLIRPDNPTQVFAATRTGGVYYSADSGANWTAVNQDLGALNVGSLSIYVPSSGDPVLYAGTYGAGVYRTPLSEPENLTWVSINNGLPTFSSQVFLSLVDVTVLDPDPGNPARQLGAGTGGCFYPIVCASVSGYPPGVPATGYLPGVWERLDPSDWQQIGHNGINEYDSEAYSPNVSTGLDNMNVLDLAYDPLDDDHIFVATQGGVFTSSDDGFAWTGFNTGLSANLQVNAIAMNALRLYIGTAEGLYRAQ